MKASIAVTVLALTAGCASVPAAYDSTPVAVSAPRFAVEMTYEPKMLVSADPVDVDPVGLYDRPLVTGRVLAGTQISMRPTIAAPDGSLRTLIAAQ
jgi:hypothetical protein